MTTTNTAAASLSDEPMCRHCYNRKSAHTAKYESCPEEGMGNYSFSAIVDVTPTQQAGATIADWRNLYEIVYGHECSFESFMATVDELSREASIAAGGAQEPIYQVMVGEKWVDSTAAEYAAVSNEKRIVYAAPLPRVAATALDGGAVYAALGRRAQSYVSREAVDDVLTAVHALLAASNGEQEVQS